MCLFTCKLYSIILQSGPYIVSHTLAIFVMTMVVAVKCFLCEETIVFATIFIVIDFLFNYVVSSLALASGVQERSLENVEVW